MTWTSSGARSGAARVGLRGIAVGAAAAGALALTGCGGGDGGSSGSASSPAASPTPTSTSTAGTGGGDGGSTGASEGLQGSWLATTGGKPVALVVTGKQAGLFVTGGTVCTGTAGEEAGMRMIHLSCTKDDTSRATGMVDSVNGSTLKVTWSGKLGTETYTRAEGGKLPSGLPTAGLGQ